MLISALPIGYISDKLISRRKLAKIGGVLYALATTVTMAVVLVPMPDHARYYAFTGCLALQGLFGGVVSGPIQAMLADETPPGRRSEVYVLLFAAYLFSSVCGPLVAICLFWRLGNHWGIDVLETVLCVGFALQWPTSAAMLGFARTQQDDELDAAAERRRQRRQQAEGELEDPLLGGGDDAEGDLKDEAGGTSGMHRADSSSSMTMLEHGTSWMGVHTRRVPLIMFLGTVLISIGSGMTTKFFPLFFLSDLRLTPIEVQAIYACLPLLMAPASHLCHVAANVFGGRVASIMVFKFFGISLLLCMWALEKYAREFSIVKHPIVMCLLYLCRTSIINSTYPLEESILMDTCPASQRSRWKSLESISQFGWCGSAALGGVLCDHHGYGFTFLVTACIQATSACVYAPILGGAVPPEHKDGEETDVDGTGDDAVAAARDEEVADHPTR